MKQNQMFSSRDTLEEAHEFATDIALSLDRGDQIYVLTAIHVLTNTAIKLLDQLETTTTKLLDEAEGTDSRLREDFNIEGTTTGRAYGAYTDSPSSTTVRLRSQIDELTRQVTDPHDLRFVLFVLDYILAREKPL